MCRGEWSIPMRLANETRANNDGRIICLPCSRRLKSSGRSNPNATYNLDDSYFESITTEAQAYLLGWFASDGAIRKGSISLFVHSKDATTLTALRNELCRELPIRSKKPALVGFTVSSQRLVRDVCRLLDIVPGKKSHTVGFPMLSDEVLQWAFLRGLFDGDGSITSIRAALKRKRWPAPRCNLVSNSPRLLDAVAAFCKVPAYRGRDVLEWGGANALDFLGRLYKNATIALSRKRDLYLDWCCWTPIRTGSGGQGAFPLFRWARTLPNAVPPSKRAESDSGFDLTLVAHSHSHGNVQFFRTGLRVQPEFGWYFDLVPRSSISKTGYVLANSVGVIDRGYTGEILVPLIKVDANACDLELPIRLVQIIPRPIIAAELVEVQEFDDTARGADGFGSSGAR